VEGVHACAHTLPTTPLMYMYSCMASPFCPSLVRHPCCTRCATECHARDGEAAWRLAATLACDACSWGGCGAGDDLQGTDSVQFRAMGEQDKCPIILPCRELRHSVFSSCTRIFELWIDLHVHRHLPTSELCSVRRQCARVCWSLGRPRRCQRQDFAWQLDLVRHDSGR
jgi:hypothetical protein